MKKLRIACFILALVNFLYFIASFIWPIQNNLITNNEYLLYLGIAARIMAVVITVILAGKLNRSFFGWFVFSLLLPWLSCFIIAFLNENEYDRSNGFNYESSWYNNDDGYSSYRSSSYDSTYLSDKSCSACGRSVSLSSLAGQRCPHCGAYWSDERRIIR